MYVSWIIIIPFCWRNHFLDKTIQTVEVPCSSSVAVSEGPGNEISTCRMLRNTAFVNPLHDVYVCIMQWYTKMYIYIL